MKMSGFVGVLVSDPWLQSQFTQVELRTLKSKVSFFFFGYEIWHLQFSSKYNAAINLFREIAILIDMKNVLLHWSCSSSR